MTLNLNVFDKVRKTDYFDLLTANKVCLIIKQLQSPLFAKHCSLVIEQFEPTQLATNTKIIVKVIFGLVARTEKNEPCV